MSTRIDVTIQLKQANKTVTRSEKSEVLDQPRATTGLSRVIARHYLPGSRLGVKNIT